MPLSAGHEFSERPFVLGSLVGLRHVIPAQDAEGRFVQGPHAQYRYRPGENVADCNVDERARWLRRKTEWEKREQATADGTYQRTFQPGRVPGVVVSRIELERFKQAAEDEKLELGLQILNRNFVRHFASMTGNDDLIVVQEPLLPYKPKPFLDPEPQDSHRAGTGTCTCGFYAYFDTGGGYQYGSHANMGCIVEGYGLTVVGSRGFRSEKLKILALIKSKDCYADSALQVQTFEQLMSYPRRNEEQVQIARYYDVPLFDTLDQALAEYPLTKPEEA